MLPVVVFVVRLFQFNDMAQIAFRKQLGRCCCGLFVRVFCAVSFYILRFACLVPRGYSSNNEILLCSFIFQWM